MNEEKVKSTETTTEETKVGVDSGNAGTPDVAVSTEKTVEESSEQKSDDSKADDADSKTESNVNVKVENNMPSSQSEARDPNKNYEAAQPVVDPVI